MPFLLVFTGMMLTDVPESATKISYLFVALPRTFPLISGEDLYISNLDICTLFIISVSALLLGGGGVDEGGGGGSAETGGGLVLEVRVVVQ